MTDPLDHTGSANQRMDRVETQVSSLGNTVANLSTAIVEVRGELRSVGTSLNTIIDTLKSREQEAAESQRAAKPNVVAISAVLVTLILALIAGAWSLGGESARSEVTDEQRAVRLETIERRSEELERRVYNMKGGK